MRPVAAALLLASLAWVPGNTGVAHGMAAASTDPSTGAERGCASRQIDPFSLYGDTIRFRVYRNDSPVGWHEVRFARDGADLRVETQFTVAVQVLFVTAYRYEYEATDVWRDGCLKAMQVRVNDDGTPIAVEARSEGEHLRVTGPNGQTVAPLGIFPTHHWHPGVLDENRVLNTITGKVSTVDIIDQGSDRVTVSGAEREARRYAYTGDLRTEVWYDAQGRWVKMRFSGKDGSTIEYRCETCSRAQTALR